MSEADRSVFISYRRSTSKHLARAIFMDLRAHGYDVFIDVDTIDSGVFDAIILNQIAARKHFLVLLSPGALDRCDDPDDWLRQEIEYAFDQRRNIVPVIEEGFRFEDARPYLVGKLSELPRYNGVLLYHAYFDAALKNLRTRFLKEPEHNVKLVPTPESERTVVEQRIAAAARQPVPTERELNAEKLFRIGVKYSSERKYELAIDNYTEAIDLNPNDPLPFVYRGDARYYESDYDGAIDDYSKAIELDSEQDLGYFKRGYIFRLRHDYDKAIEDFSQAILYRPSSFMSYYYRAGAYYHKSQLE